MRRVLERVVQASLFFFALFIPFSIAGETIALGFGALAWVLLGLARDREGQRPPALDPARWFSHPMAWPSLLLVVSSFPSVLLSHDSARALRDWSSYWMLLVLFFAGSNLRRHSVREMAFWTLVVSGSISSLVGFVQRAGGLDVGFIHIGPEYRVSSTLYTMTFAGILYQLIVLNCSVALARGMRRRSRVLLALAIALQFGALLLTMTRGAWLALVAGVVALSLLVRGRRMAWIGIALVVSLVGVAFVNFHVQKGRSIPELLHGGLDRDAGTRVVLWDIAWHLFKEHPVLGIGMGDFTIDANAMLAGRQVTTTVDTHNVYLQVLATRGILGFVPFVYYWVVLFMWLFRLRRRMGKGSRGYHVATGAIATAVAVLVGGLTELNIDDAEVWFAFMFVTGLAFSYMQDVMAGAGDASPDTPEPSV